MEVKNLNYKVIGILLGLAFGAGGIFFAYLVVINTAPTRGGGLLVMVVILLGLGGYKIAKLSPTYLEKAVINLEGSSRTKRAYMLGVGLWGLAVLLFVILFEPFGGYMSDDELLYSLKVFLFPPAIIALGHYGFEKFVKSP